jgi:hypothetical protein
MKNNRFQRGSGVFTCDICGRNTRNVGQSTESRLCIHCWDLSGLENMKLDGCYEATSDRERDSLLAGCVALGGNEEKIRKSFEELWA